MKRTASQVLRHPTLKRAREIDENLPLEQLKTGIAFAKNVKPRNILHWFRNGDLRVEDNRALAKASEKAQKSGKSLVACYLFVPEELEWHGWGPAKTDFLIETLQIVRDQLKELEIPFISIKVDKKNQQSYEILKIAEKYDVSHVYANIQYEYDELMRDVKTIEQLGDEKVFVGLHDQTVLEPGTVVNANGSPRKVFSRFHEGWSSDVSRRPQLYKPEPLPSKNLTKIDIDQKEAEFEIPDALQFKTTQERDAIRRLWPAGHAAAVNRLKKFVSEQIDTYGSERSTPATDNSSRLSPYFALGSLGVREALTTIAEEIKDGHKKMFSGSGGVWAWVREIVFREFYRQMIAISPHITMNLPQNLKFDNIIWDESETSEGNWKRWCDGTTGFPFVDAGMRQLQSEAYMHNRLRMNVASFLKNNLLIDYRRGARFFAEKLIDWDHANNSFGWEPSYTTFNPVIQGEKCDPDGEYIRKWIPELREVKGKAIFEPSKRMPRAQFEKLGYPEPIVDFQESKSRAYEAFHMAMSGTKKEEE